MVINRTFSIGEETRFRERRRDLRSSALNQASEFEERVHLLDSSETEEVLLWSLVTCYWVLIVVFNFRPIIVLAHYISIC